MRINLMDASLKLPGGHPHDIDLQLTNALVRMGHDVHVYCHLEAIPEVKEKYAQITPITPLFTIDPYQSPKPYSPDLGNIVKNLDGSLVTASELTKTRSADVWLWPSIYAHQVLACAFTKSKALITGCIHHPPDFFSSGDPAWWQYALMQAQAAQLNFKVNVIEPETRYPFLPLTVDGIIHIAPYPNDGLPLTSPRTAMKTIGVFGAQRQEKGESLLVPLLTNLGSQGYQVILQNSSKADFVSEYVDGIQHLGHVPNLNNEVAKCDLVLAPYHADAYYQRGSGIVMNAIACGVPVIAPAGSAPGRFIEQTGAGVLFNQYTVKGIETAIQKAAANYTDLAQAAYLASNAWPKTNGIDKFLHAMIE